MQDNKLVTGEHFSKEKFKRPSKEFGVLPFWFVNGEMEYEEMARQIGELADKGMPGFIFHSRFGIKDYMAYMGKEWLARYNFAAKKAAEFGMQVWVYDEYNWPSGTCNQEIMTEHPEYTSRYLQLVINRIPGQFFTFLEGTDSRYHDLEQSEPIFACAILDENIKNHKNEIVNLMPNISFDKVISWEAPAGPWHLCYFIERKSSWYSDVLNEEVTKEFLRKTHEKYKAAVPGALPDSVKGFYTDEPAMNYFMAGSDNLIIPWTAKMFGIFRDHNGYDLKKCLPQLFFDIGDDYHKVRHDFWSTLSKQYEKSYYHQIRRWCEENGVFFTGHLLHEEFLRAHAKNGGNLFHMLKNLHITGVDHLYPRIGTREMPEEHVAIKIASSAAHQNGSQRLICESMGGAYWDCTMERMKWIADWEFVLGVNIFNPHGFHYSIEGERKRDWPPSQFYHHSWWKYYGCFNDYLKRLAFVMTGGRHVARVAVLYPINHLWANFLPQNAESGSKLCEDDFAFITDALLRLHYDFDYIDEDMLQKMDVSGGKIRIKGESYDVLIVPPMSHIKEKTAVLMLRFYQEGGKLVFDTLLPFVFLEGTGKVNRDVFGVLFDIEGERLLSDYLNSEKDWYEIVRRKNDRGGETVLIRGAGLASGKATGILGEALEPLVDRDVMIDNEDLFYLHRIKDDVPFYFIINPENHPISTKITLARSGIPLLYDLESGEIRRIWNYTCGEGSVTIPWNFSPIGSVLFSFEADDTAPAGSAPHVEDAAFSVEFAQNGLISGYTSYEENDAIYNDEKGRRSFHISTGTVLPALDLPSQWEFARESDNALVIQSWKFTMAAGENRDFYLPDFPSDDWFEYTIGGWELQLPREREDRTYPVDVLYKISFTVLYIAENVKLLIDGFKCRSYDLYINGTIVRDRGRKSSLDAEIREVPIKQYLKEGINDISIKMTVEKKTHGLLDFVKLTGDFALRSSPEGYVMVPHKNILRTGSWTEQGYPFYSGTGVYTSRIIVPGEYLDNNELFLYIDCGRDVAEVRLNGRDAGRRLWAPYRFKVSEFLHEGENTISIKITNTMFNLLEGIQQPSGVFGGRFECFNRFKVLVPE